jgi:hypothetical protein
MKLPLHRDQALRLDRTLAFGPRAWAELQTLATLARDHTPNGQSWRYSGPTALDAFRLAVSDVLQQETSE